jgi:hypothetical protein
MEYPISEILDRYSIAVLKKQRLDADILKLSKLILINWFLLMVIYGI